MVGSGVEPSPTLVVEHTADNNLVAFRFRHPRVRMLAAEARVPMVQDIPLARALHSSCELGQEVPAQLFTAVARVLAFVMHLSNRGVRGGMHRPGFEAPDLDGLPKAGRRR